VFDDSQERPADILISNDSTGLHLSVDVSLTSPHVASNNTNSGVGNAAIAREKQKLDKYGTRLKESGITCAPMVMEHYGGFTSYLESMVINGFASAWSKNDGFPFDFCKRNVKDRLSVEHAKIIASIFTDRMLCKDTDNRISYQYTMYDGSSGFRSWANATKEVKVPISILDEGKLSLSVDPDTLDSGKDKDTEVSTGDWDVLANQVEWGDEPIEPVAIVE